MQPFYREALRIASVLQAASFVRLGSARVGSAEYCSEATVQRASAPRAARGREKPESPDPQKR